MRDLLCWSQKWTDQH